MMPDCDREGRVVRFTPHTNDRFFFLAHLFISEGRFLNNAVTSIADDRQIVMTLLWRLMASLPSVR